ncbi:AGAP009321-PA-like protein [Anopheles sinensis]|uniref:AGAP009321-PA-like protein n=1 Tax=Anopheles sinensis TaxID=74873 RepID=A0A084VM61_ANOSI|nr:AGAP009321-PA-like protein [Anopheles sinensis]
MEYNTKTAHRHNLNRELTCVEYPGIVVNNDRMLETLGGMRDLSTTFDQGKRRLELRFRPDCMYAKPVYGDPAAATAVALKLVVRRKKSNPEHAEVKSVHIAGSVRKIYKFGAMCDFQQVPAFHSRDTGKVECLYDEFVPKGADLSYYSDKPSELQYFLPPPSFSRNDIVNKLVLRESKITNPESASARPGKSRQKHGLYHSFSMNSPIPTEPTKLCQEMLETRLIAKQDLEIVRQAFETRPIWTKHALRNEIQFQVRNNMMGVLLPAVAFFYVNGPWRSTWVRFGYDPRKDFEARMFQMLDFRVRAFDAMHETIKVKRVATVKANKTHHRYGPAPQDQIARNENSSVFDEDTIPPCRIVFYQYCDIHLKKIKEMLSKVPTPMGGTVCDERNGWLPNRFDEQCRNIMSEIVVNNIRKRNQAVGNVETDVSGTEEGDTTTEFEGNEQDSGSEGDPYSSEEEFTE